MGFIALQHRGLAFTIGGDKGLENHVTIPSWCYFLQFVVASFGKPKYRVLNIWIDVLS
jgi:hypothetical protein